MSADYEQGRRDYGVFLRCKHYAYMPRDLDADLVMKLFLPPVPQDMMQIARPLPPRWREWIRGFEDARTAAQQQTDEETVMSTLVFEEPMNPEAVEVLMGAFGPALVARDETIALLNSDAVSIAQLSELAQAAEQPVTYAIAGEGDIKELSDGTRYQVTPRGWVRLDRE